MSKHVLPVWAALCVLLGGCATERFVTDARHPEIAIKEDGGVTYRNQFVDPEDLPDLLERSGLTRKDTIHIHYPDTLQDLRVPSRVVTILMRAGYPRTVLVGERKSSSHVGRTEPAKKKDAGTKEARPRVRYK